MKYVNNPCTEAAWNMAHDEFLLESVQDKVLCLWQNAPSVIVGRNQSVYAEVNLPFLQERGIALARRVTGGGAVYHDLGNLNYSIAGPVSEMDDALDLVPATLRRMGVPCERSGRNDILVEGRKCSGYAKRLSGTRMLIHGTLMWDVDLATLTQALQVPGSKLEAAGIASVRSRVANLKEYLPRYGSETEFASALLAALKDACPGPLLQLSQGQLASIERMAQEKFRSWDWVYGQSPESSFRSRKKFACGTVEAHFVLKHGVLESVQFGGDFLGNRPAEELAALLTGRRLEDIPAIAPVSDFFDGLTPEEFLSLFQ